MNLTCEKSLAKNEAKSELNRKSSSDNKREKTPGVHFVQCVMLSEIVF